MVQWRGPVYEAAQLAVIAVIATVFVDLALPLLQDVVPIPTDRYATIGASTFLLWTAKKMLD